MSQQMTKAKAALDAVNATNEQTIKARAALAAVRNIPIDQLISAGVQLAPLFRQVFVALAEGFKRIGLRGKMEALIAVNEAQQEQLDKVTAELQALAQRVAELENR